MTQRLSHIPQIKAVFSGISVKRQEDTGQNGQCLLSFPMSPEKSFIIFSETFSQQNLKLILAVFHTDKFSERHTFAFSFLLNHSGNEFFDFLTLLILSLCSLFSPQFMHHSSLCAIFSAFFSDTGHTQW